MRKYIIAAMVAAIPMTACGGSPAPAATHKAARVTVIGEDCRVALSMGRSLDAPLAAHDAHKVATAGTADSTDLTALADAVSASHPTIGQAIGQEAGALLAVAQAATGVTYGAPWSDVAQYVQPLHDAVTGVSTACTGVQ